MFCGEDEFYDGVVGLCSKCSDICAVINDFCTVNCPDYVRHVISSTGSRHMVTSFPAVKATVAVSRDSDTLKLLMMKPLFWTSLASLCISVVATTVLVALCVCRRRRPATQCRTVRRRQHLMPTSDQQIALAHHKGKTAPECNVYSDSPCHRDHVTTISKQESCGPGGMCISLCTVGSRHVSLDRKSSYISRVTDHPQSNSISWIRLQQPIYHRGVGIPEDKTQTDEETDWTLDERRIDGLNKQRCRGKDKSQYEVVCQMDSGNSSLLTTPSERHLDTDVIVTSLICDGQRHLVDNNGDWLTDDDDTQVKLQCAEQSTTQLLAVSTASHFTALQCSIVDDSPAM